MVHSQSLEGIEALYNQPFFELISQARATFLEHWEKPEVQLCSLLSIKTGGCSEDCAYCAQSAHHSTGLEREQLLDEEAVMQHARQARDNGATRFCMGAAWRGVREEEPKFKQVCGIIEQVAELGMEVCVTLGSLTEGAARRLKEVGVTAYNHNIDTSPEFYPSIVTTHTFEDRLETIQHAQRAGMAVCCGGIIGMGESVRDRLRMVQVLTGFDPAPESVPINCLTPIAGTPLAEQGEVDIFELVRLVATVRLLFPRAKVRLSAGRTRLSREGQALCFFAGANSIFFGSKLLTARNPQVEQDMSLLHELGLVRMPAQPQSCGVEV